MPAGVKTKPIITPAFVMKPCNRSASLLGCMDFPRICITCFGPAGGCKNTTSIEQSMLKT